MSSMWSVASYGTMVLFLVPVLVGMLILPDTPSVQVDFQPSRLLGPSLRSERLSPTSRACAEKPRVVVVLSTYLGSASRLREAVTSLAQQSCRPDAVLVFVSGKQSKKLADPKQDLVNRSVLKSIQALESVELREKEGPALLAALEVEQDPDTWLIMADDDTVYHEHTILALVTAASVLPSHVAPAFSCREVWVENSNPRWRAMPFQAEGTVKGWCGAAAGVLFKRWFFDDEVFNFRDAPASCQRHEDLWAAGHLLSKGLLPYLIHTGFKSERRSMHPRPSVSYQGPVTFGSCLRHFSAFWRPYRPEGKYRHPHQRSRAGEDLAIAQFFFQRHVGRERSSAHIFLEVAVDGSHPRVTEFFEKELGWRGVRVAPQARPSDGSAAVDGAVCGKAGLRQFLAVGGGYGGFEDAMSPELVRQLKSGFRLAGTAVVSEVKCHLLQEVLDKAQLRHLKLLVLAAFAELEVLQSFPFKESTGSMCWPSSPHNSDASSYLAWIDLISLGPGPASTARLGRYRPCSRSTATVCWIPF
ncbi:unnamed protein product [Effrenium voratum]|nr:unnamed protein product [Effrenium voratum]